MGERIKFLKSQPQLIAELKWAEIDYELTVIYYYVLFCNRFDNRKYIYYKYLTQTK